MLNYANMELTDMRYVIGQVKCIGKQARHIYRQIKFKWCFAREPKRFQSYRPLVETGTIRKGIIDGSHQSQRTHKVQEAPLHEIEEHTETIT